MRANVLTDWNKLEMLDVPTPVPQKGQILVKMIYAGICGSDVTVSRHKHPTATIPRIMCHELFGSVAEIAEGTETTLKVGDRVVVHPLTWCGVCEACSEGNFHVCRNLGIKGLHIDGGFAEYVLADAAGAFRVPDDIPDRVAALTEPLSVGFHAHMRAGTQPGDNVLVIGAGPIGIVAAMCAKYFHAGKIVLTEINPVRAELARSFGFEVIDPSATDLVAEVNRMTDGVGFDRVIEASGSAAGAGLLGSVCRIRGTVLLVGIPGGPTAYESGKLILKEIHMVGARVCTREDYRRSLEMLCRFHRSGTFNMEALIDREIPLEALSEGLELQASGKNVGKILVAVGK